MIASVCNTFRASDERAPLQSRCRNPAADVRDRRCSVRKSHCSSFAGSCDQFLSSFAELHWVWWVYNGGRCPPSLTVTVNVVRRGSRDDSHIVPAVSRLIRPWSTKSGGFGP